MSVVLPAPFGPSTTQRSPSSTDQFTPSRIVLAPRRTVTSVRLSTSPISTQPSSPTVGVMSLDIPRSILVALWAPRLGEAPDPAEVAVAAQAVRGEADDDARGLTSARSEERRVGKEGRSRWEWGGARPQPAGMDVE